MGGINTTKTEISQIIYKTAVENKPVKEIADELEIPKGSVHRCIRMNKYAIQKRAMEFVDSTLDISLEVVKNSVKAAAKLSVISPDDWSKNELAFQKNIGIPCVQKSLEIGGVVGAPNSHSGVTQNIYQQNNTQLSGNIKDFLKGMGDNLKIDDSEVIDVGEEDNNNPIELESV